MPFAPGQFNMIYVFGIGEVPISISGDPLKRETLVHTIRAIGPVTRKLEQLRKGAVVGIRGPFGTAWPVEPAQGKDVLIIPGGLGLPPLRPVIYHILAHRESYRKVSILYGARTPADLLFKSELTRWRAKFDLQVDVTVDTGDSEWRGNVGVVPALIEKARFEPLNTVAMTCGPEVMMRFTIDELRRRGVPDAQIYVSMERNMKCAVGFCGHCQYREKFICKDGAVFSFEQIKDLFGKREL